MTMMFLLIDIYVHSIWVEIEFISLIIIVMALQYNRIMKNMSCVSSHVTHSSFIVSHAM